MLLHSQGSNPRHQKTLESMLKKYHSPNLTQNQCSSTHVRTIDASLPLVWSIVKQFDNPRAYNCFIKRCTILTGDGTGVGSVRELELKSGLAGKSVTERLDNVEYDDSCLMIVSRIRGDDRLENYKSTITLHESEEHKTVLIESYVVDIPYGSCKEDTYYFADTIIGFNLRSLAKLTQDIHACITSLASHY